MICGNMTVISLVSFNETLRYSMTVESVGAVNFNITITRNGVVVNQLAPIGMGILIC